MKKLPIVIGRYAIATKQARGTDCPVEAAFPISSSKEIRSMVWSNWQGAIWRGAMLVLLFWSGLAWTQTPAPVPVADPGERIMVVHENGKHTRCRVLETWQEGGRVAHLLEVIETGEKITIVDEPMPGGVLPSNPRAVPKRIFAWGPGRRTPPDGSPMPPHFRLDSSVVINNETPPPSNVVVVQGPAIVNRGADATASAASFDNRNDGPCIINDNGSGIRSRQGLLQKLFAKKEVVVARPTDPQVVDFRNPTPGGAPMMIVNEPSPPLIMNRPVTLPTVGQELPSIDLPPVPQPSQAITPPVPQPYQAITPPVPQPYQAITPPVPQQYQPIAPTPTLPTTSTPLVNPNLGPANPPMTGSVASPAGSLVGDPSKQAPCKPAEPVAKKSWYPGANLHGWLQGRSTPSAPKADTPKTEAVKVEEAKTDEAKKLKQVQDLLAQQNKQAEKQLADKIASTYKTPFSTAMLTPLPTAPQPEFKKPEPAPLAIPNGTKDDKPAMLPAPPSESVKRDMWGNGGPVSPSGKSVLDPAGLVKLPPPASRVNDPLLSPERLQKVAMQPPVPRDTTESGMLPGRFDPRSDPFPPPRAGQPASAWPLGTQSVAAAKSGMLGPITYVPVPTVTVPLPHNPPVPPAPQGLDAPQLNAYVNAFTPPPPPKGQPQQQLPMQGMMPPQQMANYGNPMMTQQQMMMQQQMMAQQQMLAQQQMMMQYGYRPNSAMMNPYLPQQPMMGQGMPSQGPMANYSRQYVGPQAPNPFAANPAVQTGFAPTSYPPMRAMMPQAPMMQPASYQQQPVPTQQQNITQQVEQLIKVLRESPYPAQREWAAQSLTSFEWRVHPQIVPALIQSASQDPAASVRAGCVYCLGRMNAAVEPVFGTLHAMRNDIDPRVRAEVEQAFTRLGQTPMAPQ
jgi:hypothetical protein